MFLPPIRKGGKTFSLQSIPEKASPFGRQWIRNSTCANGARESMCSQREAVGYNTSLSLPFAWEVHTPRPAARCEVGRGCSLALASLWKIAVRAY
ncbi:hypothetical protein SRHO_G00228410 [Serrasalmus rhombeus]